MNNTVESEVYGEMEVAEIAQVTGGSSPAVDIMEIDESVAVKLYDEGGLEQVVNQIKDVVDNYEYDLTTATSRGKIASLSRKVSTVKVKLDSAGKELVSDLKAQCKLIDNKRKKMRDDLDVLRDQARQPLTDWENAEEKRKSDIKDRIDSIRRMSVTIDFSSEQIELLIEAARKIVIDDSFGEFETEGHRAKEDLLKDLVAALARELDAEAQKSEIERLKKEAEDRERIEKERQEKERLEKIQREAAEKARLEAEEKSRKEREEEERKRVEAETRARLEAERAEKADRERKEAIEQAKRDAELAEQRRIEAEAQAKREAEAAAERARQEEIDRAKAEEERQKAEQEKREANKRHVGAIRKKAKERFMSEAGLSEADARKVVMAIDKRVIPQVSITY